MRLLHVFPSFGIGGQQRRLAALAAAFGGTFEHAIVSLDHDLAGETVFTPGLARIMTHPIRKSSGVSAVNIGGLRRLIEIEHPDLLCTYNWGSIEAALANRLGPDAPHVHFEDGFGPDETPERQKPYRALARRMLLGRSLTIVPSQTLFEIARRVWRLPERRIAHVPNGIEVDRFDRPRATSGEVLTVGSVGALRREKNFPKLVRAFAAASASVPYPMRLVIVGDGGERPAILEAAHAAGVEDRVFLPGPVCDPESVYPTFDIFALSSDTEQMPLSLMEAMAAGLPAALTRVGDVAGMVAAANASFIAAPEDEAGLAEAIASLARDADLRMSIGAANRQKARATFSFNAMADAHRRLYLRTAEGA